uniref:Ion transport domain-containing protein n=1 Tax=Sus scrofa TaxID=9823 RepID=A0A8D0PKL6_PIG
MAAKAQKEADTQDWDAFSRPGTSTPHHRAAQGRVDHHRESHSHHRRESHRVGRSHHPEAFQDFHDNASSHHSPHTPRGGGGEAHRQGGAHPSPSHGTLLSHQNYEQDRFDKEHRHGSRSHPRGPQHPKESHPSGGPHRPRESYHHGEFQHREVPHPSRFHHPGEPDHHKESPQPGAPHHSEASRHGGHHHHKAQHHGRSPIMGSYHQGLPPSHNEHHHGHRGHHGERHPRERHPKQRHHSVHSDGYLQGDPLYEAFHRGDSHLFDSHMFSSEGSASLGSSYFHSMALRPIEPEKKSSALTLVQSGGRVRAPSSQTSSKVHPQESSSKTSESWPEEDEQIQNRKTGRVPRPHKKVHPVDLCYCLWEKLSHILWGLQRMLRKLTESLVFEAFIVFIICLNTVMLVAQTFAEVEIRGEWYFMALDSIFLCIYVVEAVLKIIALGFKYFCDPWNNLDFFIMAMAVLDFTLLQLYSPSPTRAVYSLSVFRIFKVFKSLRALRAIRVLRRLSFLTSLQKVTGTLARSLPSITAILILMFTCLCILASGPGLLSPSLTPWRSLPSPLTKVLPPRIQRRVPDLPSGPLSESILSPSLVIAVLVDNFQMALLKGLEKEKQEAAQIHEKLLDDSLTELIEAEPEEVMSEHTMQKQLIEKKFGSLTERMRELLFHFLQLVAGVEQYQQKFRSQASVIDEIVDTAFEAGEEDFRK